MCGIVAYVGAREAAPILIGGLKKLEYRGYDSAGVAVLGPEGVRITRSVGKIRGLEEKLSAEPLHGSTGIGHTRWATHGRPSEVNAHPHVKGAVAVVHNGIIENYLELRSELKATGSVFSSETDTEIFAHLIDAGVQNGLKLEAAVAAATKRVRGSYALAVVSSTEPGKIVGARMECPLVVGAGKGETLIASDVLAVLDSTRQVVFLEDGDVVVATKDGYFVVDHDNKPIARKEKHIDWSPAMAEKGGFRHFMLKEIFEQPRAVTDTMRGAVVTGTGDVALNGFSMPLGEIKRIYMIACGTSWHASLVGKFYLEEMTRIPTEVDLASEFRYRDPLVGKDSLVIAISQSGETADTLAAVAEARRRGAKVIAVCNVLESSLTREADFSFMTHAGPEIGVASTKAFTTQLVSLYLIALHMGRRIGAVDEAKGRELIRDLMGLPKCLERALGAEPEVEKLAKKYFHHRDFLYLGRSLNYPIALEGALKLKEISYIHAEGYPAGEMKHGPIALIDEEMPVVVLAPSDRSYGKILSNMEEVKARGGIVIAVVEEGDTEASGRADDSLTVPRTTRLLSPIVITVPLQLLAYHMAVLKGTDVDQPRNLAKSVTVE
jgi:glucosamine--fructose-6-phosphate aminotransferase (isomerizing)